jgi:hypothetical protein
VALSKATTPAVIALVLSIYLCFVFALVERKKEKQEARKVTPLVERKNETQEERKVPL